MLTFKVSKKIPRRGFSCTARLTGSARHRELLISIDWTEWHHEIRMLVATVVAGKRAIPVFAQAFEELVRLRPQNARENTLLRLLAELRLHGRRPTASEPPRYANRNTN